MVFGRPRRMPRLAAGRRPGLRRFYCFGSDRRIARRPRKTHLPDRRPSDPRRTYTMAPPHSSKIFERPRRLIDAFAEGRPRSPAGARLSAPTRGLRPATESDPWAIPRKGILILPAVSTRPSCVVCTYDGRAPVHVGTDQGDDSMREEFVVSRAKVFDGTHVAEGLDVYVVNGRIARLAPELRDQVRAEVVDGRGCTLLPGFIDCHTHSAGSAPRHAIQFGVTTELDMNSMPAWMKPLRRQAASDDGIADVRSSSTGVTVSGGHPIHLMPSEHASSVPVVNDPAEALRFVAARVDEGADYIKIFIENGAAIWDASLPTVTGEIVAAVTDAAHQHGLLAVAHATSLDATWTAIRGGVDGLMHIFVDRPVPEDLVDAMAAAGTFVVPTLATVGSLTGERCEGHLARDPRVAPFLPDEWRENMERTWPPTAKSPRLDYALATVRKLHAAGVRILAGSDASRVGIGPGTAHGATLHDELRLLTTAGLSNVEALRAATSLAADTFALNDRGRVAPGLQADVLRVSPQEWWK